MKKLLLLSLLGLFALPQTSHASHAAGGDITYEYIGDSTGIPYNYTITMTLYRREQGTTLSPSYKVDINSSCFGQSSVNLNQSNVQGFAQGLPPNNDTECIDHSDPGYYDGRILVYKYQGSVVLPGTCSDFTFSWSLCCRNTNIRNLQNPGNYDLYLEAQLNNIYGPNNSPRFTASAIKFFCVGQQFKHSLGTVESDQDSLVFALANPLDDAGVSIPWDSAYSRTQPMQTLNGFAFNTGNGSMIFTPSQAEVVVLKIDVMEYRYDSTLATYLLIGQVSQDLQVPILNSCNSNVTSPGLSISGTSDTTLPEIACGEKKIYLSTSSRIECSTIASDGSDFALINSLGNLVPIIAAGTDSCSNFFSNSLWLEFHKSISYNDTLTLISRKGNDLNVLYSSCGVELPSGDSIEVVVSGCAGNVKLEETPLMEFRLFPNPAKNLLITEFRNASSHRKVSVFSLQGQLIEKFAASEKINTLNISGLAPGIYLLRSSDPEFSVARFQKL